MNQIINQVQKKQARKVRQSSRKKKGEVNHNIQNIQKHSDLPEGLESSVKLFADDTSLFSAIYEFSIS